MAARRLIFVMLALLVASTFAATFASQQQTDTRESTVTEPAPAAEQNAGVAPPLEVRLDAAADGRRTVDVPVGRQVTLDVEAARADLVSIPALGLLEDVAPGSPAHFDLLLSERGSYAVRLVDARRTLATLEAREPKRAGGEQGPRPDRPSDDMNGASA